MQPFSIKPCLLAIARDFSVSVVSGVWLVGTCQLKDPVMCLVAWLRRMAVVAEYEDMSVADVCLACQGLVLHRECHFPRLARLWWCIGDGTRRFGSALRHLAAGAESWISALPCATWQRERESWKQQCSAHSKLGLSLAATRPLRCHSVLLGSRGGLHSDAGG